MAAATIRAMNDIAIRARRVRSVSDGRWKPNDDRRAASSGSALPSPRSISSRMRCSSMESAMASPPPARPVATFSHHPPPQDR